MRVQHRHTDDGAVLDYAAVLLRQGGPRQADYAQLKDTELLHPSRGSIACIVSFSIAGVVSSCPTMFILLVAGAWKRRVLFIRDLRHHPACFL
jgi:hypothetical protein